MKTKSSYLLFAIHLLISLSAKASEMSSSSTIPKGSGQGAQIADADEIIRGYEHRDYDIETGECLFEGRRIPEGSIIGGRVCLRNTDVDRTGKIPKYKKSFNWGYLHETYCKLEFKNKSFDFNFKEDLREYQNDYVQYKRDNGFSETFFGSTIKASFTFSRNYFDPKENKSIPTLFLKFSEINQKHEVVTTFEDHERNDIFKIELNNEENNFIVRSHDSHGWKLQEKGVEVSQISKWKLNCRSQIQDPIKSKKILEGRYPRNLEGSNLGGIGYKVRLCDSTGWIKLIQYPFNEGSYIKNILVISKPWINDQSEYFLVDGAFFDNYRFPTKFNLKYEYDESKNCLKKRAKQDKPLEK